MSLVIEQPAPLGLPDVRSAIPRPVHSRLIDQQSIQCGPHIKILSGRLECDQSDWETEVAPAGLKIVVLLEGQVRIEGVDKSELSVSGPKLFASVNPAQREYRRAFLPERPNRYMIIYLGRETLEEQFGVCLDGLCKSLCTGRHGYALCSQPVSRPVKALCAQITSCPLAGDMSRSLYLAGKVLELTGLAIDWLQNGENSRTGSLSSADVRRLQEAMEILRQRMRNPPSFFDLAVKVGLNTAKLNAGLRELYGNSAYGLLQEIRLHEAYQMLSTGEMSVSEAAYHVGYNAAYFSTAFKKRFGSSPREFRQVRSYGGGRES